MYSPGTIVAGGCERRIDTRTGWKVVADIGIVVNGKPDLLQIIPALRPPRRFASLLHCRQQQCDQDRDDGDHDQEFDQCKSAV